MNIESPETHTPESSETTDSATGSQDRTEASGTTDIAIGSQDRTEVRQARASRRGGHKPHAEKEKKERNKKRSSAQKEGVEARRMTNMLTGLDGDSLTYREA